MYDTILVPHAGTAAGDLALKHAIYTAKLSSSKILILHVVEPTPLYLQHAATGRSLGGVVHQLKKVNAAIKENMKKEMQKRVEICNSKGISADVIIKVGSPAEEIIKQSKRKKVDLIVMAKRRKLPGLKSLLTLGSVSRKVAEHVSCPILMIDVESKK